MNIKSGSTFFAFLSDIWQNKFVIYQLVRRDYKNRYIGSFLGFVWTIVQPVVLLVVLWAVFTKGFRAGDVAGGVSFFTWLALGMIPWVFFSEALMSSTGVFQEYSYLVKKISFKIAILPLVKLLSSFVTHVIFVVFGVVIVVHGGLGFSWYWLQFFYYLAALMVLLLGLSWVLSCLQVFVKDVAQIVSVLLQFGFWITPIVWQFDLVPWKYQFWFKLNPVFYIVDGYRKTFVFHEPFWRDQQLLGLYFWLFTLVVLIFGVYLFRKLRPHFADVL